MRSLVSVHILGRSDVARLISNQEVHLPGINKAGLSAEGRGVSARKLAAVLDIDSKAFEEKVAAYGQEAFVDAITLRRSDFLEAGYRGAGD